VKALEDYAFTLTGEDSERWAFAPTRWLIIRRHADYERTGAATPRQPPHQLEHGESFTPLPASR